MNVLERAAGKTLAIALSLALLLPSSGFANPVVAPQNMNAGGSGYKGVVALKFKLPTSSLEMPLSLDMTTALSPALLRKISAPKTADLPAVSQLQVVEVLNQLQAAGVPLASDASTPLQAEQLLAYAEKLAPGPARDSLVSFAQSMRGVAGTDAGLALSKMFDNAGKGGGGTSAKGKSSKGRSLSKSTGKPRLVKPLSIEELRWVPKAKDLPKSTADIPRADKQIVGQDQALEDIKDGLKMPGAGYNLFVSGPDGSGRETAVAHILDTLAPTMETPPDLVAVTNFSDPESPIVLELEAGVGEDFSRGVSVFVRSMEQMLPQALEALADKKQAIEAQVKAQNQERVAAVEAKAAEVKVGKFGLTLSYQETQEGGVISYAPTYEGEILATEKAVKAKVAAGAFTEKEYEDALGQIVEKMQPLAQELKAVVEQNQKVLMGIWKRFESMDQSTALSLSRKLGASLMGVLKTPTSHDTPAHKEWEAAAVKAEEDFDKEVAQVRIGNGKFGIVLIPTQTQMSISLTFEGQPVYQDDIPGLIAAGKVTQADFDAAMAEVMAAAKPFLERWKALVAAIQKQHEALHKGDKVTPRNQQAAAYVNALIQNAGAKYYQFLPQTEDNRGGGDRMLTSTRPSDHYRVSVLVSNAESGAPVIFERNPSYENLFGYAQSNMGLKQLTGLANPMRTPGVGGPTLRSGSFLKANGGFLVLNVMDVLRSPGAWQSLVQAARSGVAEIVEGGIEGVATQQGERYGIPVKVKVVLVGSPMIRMLLTQHDENFASTFAAKAEFEHALPIGDETIAGYLYFMKKMVVGSGGLVMDLARDGISAVLEYSARAVESHYKLSAQFGMLYGLLQEATYFAREAGRKLVTRVDVETAIAKRNKSLHEKGYFDLLLDRTFVVETDGARVGQINGLAVTGSMGIPARVVAKATAGKPGFVSVDKVAQMTGKSFNKALGEVHGFFKSTFGRVKAFPAEVTIAFEQNYGGIDGDSATSTKIYAVLSELSGVPIKQSFAVTGSADLDGTVQAIGGENQKIEGFFKLCKARGLTGRQGVLVPATNVSGLQLSPEVVKAVKAGQFHIYPIRDVKEGIELLTGVKWETIVKKAEKRLEEIRQNAD